MSTPSTPTGRADAIRNRARVLDAARGLFTHRGEHVQMPEIARAAGVGIGTVYRHFPSRQALIEALADVRFAEIASFGRNLAAQAPDDAGHLARYLYHVGEVLEKDEALSAAIETARGAPGSPPRGSAKAELETVITELLDRDKHVGLVREDITATDVYLMVGGLSAIIRTDSGSWRRYVELILDGARP